MVYLVASFREIGYMMAKASALGEARWSVLTAALDPDLIHFTVI